MVENGLQQCVLTRNEHIGVASIMQEEQPLAKPPERCSAELIPLSITLAHPIAETAHMMDGEIRERMEGLMVQAGILRRSGGENIRVTQDTTQPRGCRWGGYRGRGNADRAEQIPAPDGRTIQSLAQSSSGAIGAACATVKVALAGRRIQAHENCKVVNAGGGF